MKKSLFILSVLLCTNLFSASAIDVVTLVVSGEGDTKEQATQSALRSAVEQAYGVFVSANTEILNDELVKDEIATVTSGNIQSYKELSYTILPDPSNRTVVTLQAEVSTKKLATYAQSKGASCEFAGALFGANLKLLQLNKENTRKAFEHLMSEAINLIPYCYDVEMEIGEPTADGTLQITLKYYSTPAMVALVELMDNTLSALKLSDQQVTEAQNMNWEIYPCTITKAAYRSTLGVDPYLVDYISKYENYWIPQPPTAPQITYFYSPFPYKDFLYVFKNMLKEPYCVDNFGTEYSLPLDRQNRNVIYGNGSNYRKLHAYHELYSNEKEGYHGSYNAAFSAFLITNDSELKDYIQIPDVNSFNKKVDNGKSTYEKTLIGKNTFKLEIPIETLMKMTQLDVKLRFSTPSK